MSNSTASTDMIQAENERLKKESQRFSNIINQSYNPVWQRDVDLNIVYCNVAFSEIADQDGDELMDIASLELFNGHRDMAQRAWDSEQEVMLERHIIVNGQRRLFRIRELPSRADATITGFAVDITEKEEAREEVARHERAQRDFLESSTSAMAIYSKDMRLQFYNFAFVALWNLSHPYK